MSDPTTEKVRYFYALSVRKPREANEDRFPEFDRWFAPYEAAMTYWENRAVHDRAVADRAYERGYSAGLRDAKRGMNRDGSYE